MSLWFYDPLRVRRHDPFDILDTFLDDGNRLRVRDHAAKLTVLPNGDFNYTVNATGFKPEELKVDIEGEELVVRGDHQEHHEGESVHRHFVRRVRLPTGSCKDSIKCDIDEHGRLAIAGVKAQLPENEKKSIPINFKNPQPAVENKK